MNIPEKICAIGIIVCLSLLWYTEAKAQDISYAAGTFLVLDWAQTREIATNPRWVELNPILGKNPSMKGVDRYFMSALLVHKGINHFGSATVKKVWNRTLLVTEVIMVIRNRRLGIKFKF